MSIFHTKGCCTLSPELNISPCCEEHDQAYARGGTKQDRKIADIQLREGMRSRNRRILCWIYYFAVRSFGWTGFNWKEEEL